MSSYNFSALLGIATLPDLNAYVTAFTTTNQHPCYSISMNSAVPFDFSYQWVDTGSSSNGVTVAYMPSVAPNPAYLFSTWSQGGLVFIAKWQLNVAADGTVTNGGLVGKSSLYGVTTPSYPSVAVVGSNVVVVFSLSDNTIMLAVGDQNLNFTPASRIQNSAGGNEMAMGHVSCVGTSATQFYVGWQGVNYAPNAKNGSSDVSVSGFNIGPVAPFSKATMPALTTVPPAITFAAGQVCLLYVAAVNMHLCTWKQSDWNIVNATFLADTTNYNPSIAPTIDGTQLVLVWVGTDSQSLVNTEIQPVP
jgi:hypothetical protein